MRAPRLFVEAPLHPEAEVWLSEAQSGRLARVLRLGPGAEALLFNGQDGEWNATVTSLTKRTAQVRCLNQARPQTAAPDGWLLFAPVKRQATDWMVEKATELGVRALQPTLTQRTNAETVRTSRLALIAREAAEQCERLDVPEVREPAALSKLLEAWPGDRALVFADEDARPSERLRPPPVARFAVVIGPEGGFTPEERARLRGLPCVQPVSLGPRILRAETAAVAALSLAMAAWGDWG